MSLSCDTKECEKSRILVLIGNAFSFPDLKYKKKIAKSDH